MLAKKIISLQHPLIKHWVQLRVEREYREEKKRVLLIGEKPIRELSQTLKIKSLMSLEETSIPAQEHYLLTEGMLKKITGLQQPDGFAAEFDLPLPQDLSAKSHLLILDEIADPGNLGTLLRTALSFNWEGVILTPNTVDLFNDKALRASRGAPFLLPYARLTPSEIASWIKETKREIFTADLDGTPLDSLSFKPPLALILSNETTGPSSWTEPLSKKVTLPMSPLVDSLNVATAGAILLYAMRPS